MSIVELGEFRVDLQHKRLYRQQEDIAVEPKVIEVLCYFIANPDRFISLQELHQQVWPGRIVTDTAVRRTVSKLRALLGDSDPESPRFIRSQMKRGYQLICPAVPLDAASLIKPVVSDGKHTANVHLTGHRWRPISKAGVSAFLLLSITVLLVIAALISEVTLQIKDMKVELEIPGQKASLAVSPDGQFQAFVGRITNNDNWQLYLQQRNTGQVTKVLTSVPHVRFVDFVSNGKLLAYVGFRADQAELYLQSVTDLNQPPKQISLPGKSILAGPLALNDTSMLIAAGESYNGNIHYYQLDIATGLVSQFSFSSAAAVQDAYARISPDRTQLALVRANIAERKLYLQVYRLADKELLVEALLGNQLTDTRISWLNAQAILIKQHDQFSWFNLQDNTFAPLAEPADNIKELVPDNSGRFSAIYRKTTEQQLYRTAWPYVEGFSQHLQFSGQVMAVHFSYDKEYYWLIEQADNAFQLSRYYPATAVKQLVMRSEAAFELLDQTADALLLLKRQNRLELLDVFSGHVANVSLTTQQVDQGTFSKDGRSVYFAAANAGQWHIMQYDLKQARQQFLLPEYRYLQTLEHGFIAAAVDGSVWLLNEQMQRQKRLYQGIHFDLDYQLLLRDQHLMILHRNLMSDWQLVNIDLNSHEIWQRKLASSEFSGHFSLDKNGHELLFFKPKIDTNQIVSFGYNFGYSLLF